MSLNATRREPKDIADLHEIAGRDNLLPELEKHMVDDKPVPTPAMTNTVIAAVAVAPERTTRNTELSAILDEICTFLRRYIVFPSQEQTLVTTLWIVHTWTLDAFDYTPYLNISSPEKQCGKSKLLDCLRQLVAKPLAAASATPAALFRKIEEKRPTILLDEVDTVFSRLAARDLTGRRGFSE